MSINPQGVSFYLDFERMREHNGFVYFWMLVDYPEPLSGRYLSSQVIHQGDCNLMRLKILSVSHHPGPMAEGVGTVSGQNFDWVYATPGSTNEEALKWACRKSVL